MMLRILALGLIGALLSVLLRECGYSRSGILAAVVAVGIFSILSEGIDELLGVTRELAELSGLSGASKTAIKLIGISYSFGILSDICEGLGERTIAGLLITAGRLESLFIVLPYLRELLSLATSLLD